MISIAPYVLSVKRGHKEVPLDAYDGKHRFLDFVVWWLNQMQNHVLDEERRKVGSCAYLDPDIKAGVVSGVIEVGEYGYTANLFDVKTLKVSHRRKTQEAELLPFCFYLFSPAGEKRAILALQRFKMLGIRKLAFDDLVRSFDDANPGFHLSLSRLAHQTFAKKLFDDGLVKSYRFIQYSQKADIADQLELADIDEYSCEVTVKAGRDKFLPKMKRVRDVLLGRRQLATVIDLRGWEFDSIKVAVEVHGKIRTIDLGKTARVAPNIDITDDIDLLANGHPDPSSFKKIAAQIVGEFHDELPIA